MIRLAAASLLALLLAFGGSARASDPQFVIICGIGGEQEYTERFETWGGRLRAALTDRCARTTDSVRLLTETAGEGSVADAVSTLENITEAMNAVTAEIAPEQDLYLFLIGHGSYIRNASSLNLPGPDLRASRLGELLDAVPAKRIVVVNSASAGAGFINELSAPGRVIISATRNVDENNATTFMEYFLQGIEEGSADLDRDERISVLEAARQAASLTDAWYIGEGLLATEHALLDDNGDGLGVRLLEMGSDPDHSVAAAARPDGTLAASVFLSDYTFPPGTDPSLIREYLDLLASVEALRARREGMTEEEYYAELERRLVDLARANRHIRGGVGSGTSGKKETDAARIEDEFFDDDEPGGLADE